MEQQFSQLQSYIEKHQSFALVCHQKPDGDALGSLLGFSRYLETIGKEVERYCFDTIPEYLTFIPEHELVHAEQNEFFASADVLIILDSSDIRVTGLTQEDIVDRTTLVIDHHVSNTGFGTLSMVHTKASATAEILYTFLQSQQATITKAQATQLLTGIYTDTDGFSNLATTPQALQAASALLSAGGRLREITAHTLRNKSIASLKLWGRALERLRLDPHKGVAVTVIRHTDLAECKAQPEDMEGVANLLNHLADVKMAMVLREQGDGTVKGSLRTTHDAVDVSKIATMLGGGGHAKAAGFTVKGKVVEAEHGWKIVE